MWRSSRPRSSRSLTAIHAAGRQPGLSVKPRTPLSSLDAWRGRFDVVLVMTVEPGFGGQTFMRDVALAKLGPARDHVPALGGQIHVDGGVKRDSAAVVGEQGTDVLVVGSALFRKGVDMAAEIRLIRSRADEAYDGRQHDAARRPSARSADRDRMAVAGSSATRVPGPSGSER